MLINEILKEAQLIVDVPNEHWLQDKIDYSKSKRKNSYGVPYMDATTAYMKSNDFVEVPLHILRHIPGARGEQSAVRQDDLDSIMKIMNSTGKLPLLSSGEEYYPLICVAWDGSAWVYEGNHRIMAADKLGWKSLKVQVKYFDGGERQKEGLMYPSKIGLA